MEYITYKEWKKQNLKGYEKGAILKREGNINIV